MNDPQNPNLETQAVAKPQSAAEQSGTLIGRYKLLERIGEGGFGTVWMAEQREPVKRRVALKIIKLGMDTRQVIARFEVERQALAMMDHPNIARVLDAGATETGRPYFVMELVRGIPVMEYCDTEKLDTKQRLELFILICNAVQHAHQKGIIHRDLKPSNVLITLHDGVPVPKVIDFGIAKATNAELTDKTLFTEHRQMIGTPVYMSPEQAEMSGLDIDTRADIYSLGVLLYEVLTGTTPFDAARLRSAGHNEMIRILREEEPRKPSTRASALSSEPRTSVRADSPARDAHDDRAVSTIPVPNRRVDGDAQMTKVHQDAPDPAGRVEIMAPSSKRPNLDHPGNRTHGSQLENVARLRHTDAKSLIRLLRGDLDWIVMKCLEKDRRRRYETANGLAMDVRRHLSNEPVIARPPSRGYRMRKFVQRNRGAVLGATAISAVLVLGIIGTSWGLVRSLKAEREQSRERKRAEEAAAQADAVTDFLTDMLAAADPSQSGKDVPVRQVLDQASKTIATQFSNRPLIQARLQATIGKTYFGLHLYEQAERHISAALQTRRRELGDAHIDTFRSMNDLTYLYMHQRRIDEYEALNNIVVETARKAIGEEHPVTLTALNMQGNALHDRGRNEEALAVRKRVWELRRRVLGEEHLDTLTIAHNIAFNYINLGRLSEAITLSKSTFDTLRRTFGEKHPQTLITAIVLANAYADVGRVEEAIELFDWVAAAGGQVFGKAEAFKLQPLMRMVRIYKDMGRAAEAAELEKRSLIFLRQEIEKDRPAARDLNDYAWFLLTAVDSALHDPVAALSLAERACALERERNGTRFHRYLLTLALARYRLGDAEAALRTTEPMQSLTPKGDAAQQINGYAWELLTDKQLNVLDPTGSTALALVERAGAMQRETAGKEDWMIVDTLALAQHRTGDTEKAIETQKRAISLAPGPDLGLEENLAAFETALVVLRANPDADPEQHRRLALAGEQLGAARRRAERPTATPEQWNDYAWKLLTNEAAAFIDASPATAMDYAQRACAIGEQKAPARMWKFLNTLALAQQRTGDTAKAVETKKKALALMPPEHYQRKEFEQRLAEYETALAAQTNAALASP